MAVLLGIFTMGWNSLLSAMNVACVNTFGSWAVHLESGDEFKLVMTSMEGIAQFAETNKTTAFILEVDKPETLLRGSHIIVVGNNDIYEVAELSDDDTGGMTLTLEPLIISFDDLSDELELISSKSLNEKLARLALLL